MYRCNFTAIYTFVSSEFTGARPFVCNNGQLTADIFSYWFYALGRRRLSHIHISGVFAAFQAYVHVLNQAGEHRLHFTVQTLPRCSKCQISTAEHCCKARAL
jgi:hypothetical protein